MQFLRVGFRVSERRAIASLGFCRSSMKYKSRGKPQDYLRKRLRELAASRPSYGYRRLQILLKREGWKVNHKLVYRLYSEEALGLKRKKPRKKISRVRVQQPAAAVPNERWSLDFMSDALHDGRKIRVLTIVDHLSRVSPGIEVDFRFPGRRVVEALNRAVKRYGKPKIICVDNGPEFIGKDLDLWCHHHGVKLQFSRPGKPTDNAMIESFNAKVRAECLDLNWFETLEQSQTTLEEYRRHHNLERPHLALGNLTPAVYLKHWRQNRKEQKEVRIDAVECAAESLSALTQTAPQADTSHAQFKEPEGHSSHTGGVPSSSKMGFC